MSDFSASAPPVKPSNSSPVMADGQAMVGREEDVRQLSRLHAMSFDTVTTTQMALIVGPSGSGKSVLAGELECIVKSAGGIWCTGKFDVQNRADPYEPIGRAMTSLIEQNSSLWEEWRSIIQSTLGEEIRILEELIPSVSILLASIV